MRFYGHAVFPSIHLCQRCFLALFDQCEFAIVRFEHRNRAIFRREHHHAIIAPCGAHGDIDGDIMREDDGVFGRERSKPRCTFSRHCASGGEASRHEPAMNLRSHCARSARSLTGRRNFRHRFFDHWFAFPQFRKRRCGFARARQRARDDRQRPENVQDVSRHARLLAAKIIEPGIVRFAETRRGAAMAHHIEPRHQANRNRLVERPA